ncbi:MAG: hypothetical protein EOP10_13260 [Proteobacteria bacterium]|nr:MAG: hypothetical protein EOP10_13260 [Pseudomonadota bacterium]
MGIRNRTPIGTLREQRRSAENLPLLEAQAVKALVRVRAHKTPENSQPHAPERTENLIERLRTVLHSENSKNFDGTSSDYHVLQDELARISQHHQQNLSENTRDLVDLEAPRKHIETASPFRYVVIDGGKKSDDFALIPKLDRAPSNFDSYTRQLPKDPAPRLMPLTLLITDVENKAPARLPSDPSDEAASFTQSSVTHPPAASKGSVLPKSLVLSLLGDK